MHLYVDVGSIKDYLVENIDYDKQKVIDYLKTRKELPVVQEVQLIA